MSKIEVFYPRYYKDHPIESVENQRKAAYGGSDPVRLRQRMIEEPDDDDDTTDDEILRALEQMDDETRLAALELLPDEMIYRLHARGWQ